MPEPKLKQPSSIQNTKLSSHQVLLLLSGGFKSSRALPPRQGAGLPPRHQASRCPPLQLSFKVPSVPPQPLSIQTKSCPRETGGCGAESGKNSLRVAASTSTPEKPKNNVRFPLRKANIYRIFGMPEVMNLS